MFLGNGLLDFLTNDELSRRFICAAHFSPLQIHRGNVRSRLLGPAVPVHFSDCGTQSSADPSNQESMQTGNFLFYSKIFILLILRPRDLDLFRFRFIYLYQILCP